MLLIITQLSIAVFVIVGTVILLIKDDNHPL